MRNGGTARFSFDFTNLEPVVAFFDPSTVMVKQRDPDGTETIWTYTVDVEIVRDSLGHYHFVTPALDAPAGGTYTLLAQGPDYPEVRCEIMVEPSNW